MELQPVQLTDRAAEHVKRYIEKRGKGVGLRLGVRTSGCSGLAYKLEYQNVAWSLLPEAFVTKTQVLLSAGGSSYFDLVARGFAVLVTSGTLPTGRSLTSKEI